MRWISTNDRLPGNGSKVAVIIKGFGLYAPVIYNGKGEDVYERNEWECPMDCTNLNGLEEDITHWSLLPIPESDLLS